LLDLTPVGWPNGLPTGETWYNKSMNFSVLSYNTLFNSAVEGLPGILKKYSPDIICLQETLTEEQNIKRIENYGYKLADTANSFVRFGKIFGVATFYNQKAIKFIEASTLDLNTNIAEYFFYLFRVILGYNQPKTILKADFYHRKARKNFSICNLHLYVIGSNELRINHLNQALKSINFKKNRSLIVCGDFNYFPYRRKKLEKTMQKHHLIEATKNIRQTINMTGDGIIEKFTRFQRFLIPFFNKFLVKRVKTDYVFYRGLKLIKTERLEDHHSDHYPILSSYSFRKPKSF